MKNFTYIITGFAVFAFMVTSQVTTPESDLTVSKTKERIWAASELKNS